MEVLYEVSWGHDTFRYRIGENFFGLNGTNKGLEQREINTQNVRDFI